MLKGAVVPKYQMSIFDADFTGGGTDKTYKPDIVQEHPKEPAAKITDPFGEHFCQGEKGGQAGIRTCGLSGYRGI